MSLHFKLPRQQIVEVCQILHRKKMLAAADGNVSVRVSDQEILITPSGVSKAFISPDEGPMLIAKDTGFHPIF